ncbi:hypothetical protein IWQ57_006210, partial [Coemansia nantahalensis]
TLGALAEVKKGSSIDPNISAVRCLLCKSAVAYFRRADAVSMPRGSYQLPHQLEQQQQQRRHMPAPQTTVYLAKDVKDAQAIREGERASTYAEPFGVVLDPEVVGVPRGAVHIPRDLQQRATEYMRQQETEKNNRIRAFVQEQDAALERLRALTVEQSRAVAHLVAQTIKEPAPSVRSVSGATSGLAAMLRSSGSGPGSSAQMSNPFAHGAVPRNSHSDEEEGGEDDLYLQGSGEFNSMLEPRRSRPVAMRRTPSQSGDESELDGGDETQRGGHGGNLSQMLVTAGSMPVQIPAFGSSSLSADPFMSRRQMVQHSDEMEMRRRRQKMMRGMPSTFIPPHKLMDSIHENDGEMPVGSKPRDAYPMSRRHAPG